MMAPGCQMSLCGTRNFVARHRKQPGECGTCNEAATLNTAEEVN